MAHKSPWAPRMVIRRGWHKEGVAFLVHFSRIFGDGGKGENGSLTRRRGDGENTRSLVDEGEG